MKGGARVCIALCGIMTQLDKCSSICYDIFSRKIPFHGINVYVVLELNMDTTFTFKATKVVGEGKDVCYQVNLGQDILDGLTQEQVLKHATHDRIVYVQNFKGSLLRMSNSIESAEKCLKGMGYEHATVDIYVPNASPKGMIIDGVEYTKDQIAALVKYAKEKEMKIV